MSTILFQKNQESKERFLAFEQNRTNNYFSPDINAEDFAGLSWILLNKGDEI